MVKASSAAAGTGSVTVSGGVFLNEDGITANNTVTLSGGAYDRILANGADLTGSVNATSSFAGGNADTTASILQGILTAGTTLRALPVALGSRLRVGRRHDSGHTICGRPWRGGST